MKTIFNIPFILCLIFSSSLTIAQVQFSDDLANYELVKEASNYVVKAQLKSTATSSRRLQLAKSRLRLRAVDLVGNYLVYQKLPIDELYKEDLFEVFVEQSQLDFKAHVEKFTASAWENCGASKCITFQCDQDNFVLEESYFNSDFDISQMLKMNFERKRDLHAASLLLEQSDQDIQQILMTSNMFLSGRGVLEDEFLQLLKMHPNSQLQTSLFETDSLFLAQYNAALQLPMGAESFERMIKFSILFTCAPPDQKAMIYKEYEKSVMEMKALWWEIIQFSIHENKHQNFAGWENATVFDVIEYFPMALNIFGMHISNPSVHYQQALEYFAAEDMESCLSSLKDEINFNGLHPSALNLVGASYRLQENDSQALPFLLMAYLMDSETLYVKGNLALCLHELDFPKMKKLQEYLLNTTSIDPWSRTQIDNIKNDQK